MRNKNTKIPFLVNNNDAEGVGGAGSLMTGMLSEMAFLAMFGSIAVVILAGFVKGAVGFAMPMLMISGIGSFMSAEIAIAALLLPTFVANILQAFRNGLGSAWASFRKFWRFNLVLFAMILLSAQLVSLLADQILFVVLGGPIMLFTGLQLAGWHPKIKPGAERLTEISVAFVAGFLGGLTGVWGPPTILYLAARDIPKKESVRVQGVIYLMGSFLLVAAHLRSGVLNSQTIPYSAMLILPALLGQMIGMRAQDKMDQALFRKVTMVILFLAGVNLLRRGLFG